MPLIIANKFKELPPLGFGGAPIGGLLSDVDATLATAALDTELEGGVAMSTQRLSTDSESRSD